MYGRKFHFGKPNELTQHANTTLYTVDTTEFATAQTVATFHDSRALIHALIRGCLGRDFVREQSKDAFLQFLTCSLLKKTYLVSEIIYVIEGICQQKHEN